MWNLYPNLWAKEWQTPKKALLKAIPASVAALCIYSRDSFDFVV